MILQKIYIKKIVYLITISLILFYSINIRYNLIQDHFIGGVDDLGVAKTIIDFDDSLFLYKKNTETNKIILRNSINHQIFFKTIDKLQILDLIYSLRLSWNHINAVPNNWTYAPLQFYITQFLINSKMNLEQLKFWGRLPSFFFSICSLFLILFYFFRFSRILELDRLSSMVLSLTILGFSIQNIVYAAQMHSFSIGVFSVIILLIIFSILITKKNVPDNKKIFFIGIFFGLLTMTQYQVLFFLPAFIITFNIKFIKNTYKKDLINSNIYFLIGFFIISIPFVFSHLIELTNSGVNWNKGPNGIYLYKLNNSSFFDCITYTINFFTKNGISTVFSMLSPSSSFNILNNILKYFFVFIILFGILSFKSYNQVVKYHICFICIIFLTWLLLLLFQKITLSPSRHNMILTPIFILSFIFGLYRFISFFKTKYSFYITLLFSAYIFYSFKTNIAKELIKRKDSIYVNKLTDSIINDSVLFVLSYETNYSLNFLKPSNSQFRIIEINDPWGVKKYNFYNFNKKHLTITNNSYFVAFSQARTINNNDIQKLNEAFLNEFGFNPPKIELIKSICIDNLTMPDWAFPPISQYNYNGYYYYLFKIIF